MHVNFVHSTRPDRVPQEVLRLQGNGELKSKLRGVPLHSYQDILTMERDFIGVFNIVAASSAILNKIMS